MNKDERKFLSKLKPVGEYHDRNELKKEIIKMIAFGGFAAACLVAPGLAHTAKLFANPSGRENARVRRMMRSLEAQGYIRCIDDKYRLTPDGVLYFNKIQIQEFAVPEFNSTRWDGLWHMVMFDIPESHKTARDSFRKKLLEFGFENIQQSVYLHPNDYSRELHALAELHDVKIDIITLEVLRIDREKDLRRQFDLK